jgi:hypothetical protein
MESVMTTALKLLSLVLVSLVLWYIAVVSCTAALYRYMFS